MAAFLRMRLGELEKQQKETGSSAGHGKKGRTRSPRADPAGAKGRDVAQALRKLASADVSFISRGDKSGTHAAELRYWRMAGIDSPAFANYKQCGCGMGQALNIASSTNFWSCASTPWIASLICGESGPYLWPTMSVFLM